MVVKMINSHTITEETLKILDHAPLKKNEFFPVLEAFFTGDFENFDEKMREKIGKEGAKIG